MSEPVSTISKESRVAIDTRFEKDSPHAWLRYSQSHREHEPMGIPIGRELYTAPFIWVDAGILQKHYQDQTSKRWKCLDKFTVKKMTVKDGVIKDLEIVTQHDMVAFTTAKQRSSSKSAKETKTVAEKPSQSRYARISSLKEEAIKLGIKEEGLKLWIEATFNGKQMKDFSDNEIKLVESHIQGLIKDKQELNG